MTTTQERLALIRDYKDWRETREIDGHSTDLEAYEQYLVDREPMELLEQIRALAIDLGDFRGPHAGDFAQAVQDLLGINNKEVVVG